MSPKRKEQPKKSPGEQKIAFQFQGDVDARGAQFNQAETITTSQNTTFVSESDTLSSSFTSLLQVIQQAQLTPAQRDQAGQAVAGLKTEIAKEKSASGKRMSKLMGDLLDLVPGTLSALAGLFVNPLVAPLVNKL